MGAQRLAKMGGTYLLDYGAGNVLSVVNAVEKLGQHLQFIREAADFDKADRLIFPGVGAFGACMEKLEVRNCHGSFC